MEVPYEQIGLISALIIALVALVKVIKYLNGKVDAANDEVKAMQRERVLEMAAALIERDKILKESNLTIREMINLLKKKRETGHVEEDH